jgi:hypothetical protein
MKVTAIVDERGEVIGTARGSNGDGEVEAGLMAGPGQILHELDVPKEVHEIEDPEQLHKAVRKHLEKGR